MEKLSSKVSSDFVKGWNEFCEAPGEYSYSAANDLVQDYWDLGAAVLAGFAFNDFGGEVAGEVTRYSVGAASLFAVASGFLWKANHNRNNRNILAGVGCLSLGGLSEVGVSSGTLESYAVAAPFFAGSVLGEAGRESPGSDF